ncbi:transposase [Streptomyces sp. NBC_01549]|uniref:transposase n=1 Tax=Streptomyces sp. NBC_01549 TaxID=2975874 RepID=UPI00338DC0D7
MCIPRPTADRPCRRRYWPPRWCFRACTACRTSYTNRYSAEYKRDAVELVRSSGRTVTEVARELGISSESLRGWVKKAHAQEAGTGPDAVPAGQGVDDRDGTPGP